MAVNTVDFRQNGQSNTSRLPSPDLWADCPLIPMVEGTQHARGVGPGGIHHWDDFDRVPLIGTQTTQIGYSTYKVFNTGAGVVAGVSTVNSVEIGGGIIRNNVDTDNDSGSLADAYPSYMMTGSTTNSGKLWFEARCCFSPVTTNGIGWFVGLAEVDQWTLATGVPFNAGDAITNSASAIGFRKPEDNTTTFDTVYSDRATSFTNIGAGEATGIAAYTWFKIGFVYDPSRSSDCVRFFLNNQQLTTPMTLTTLTGTTNLKANALGRLQAVIADSSGTSGEFFMDWWRVAQLLPTV